MKKMSVLKSFVMLMCLTMTGSVMAYQNDSRMAQTQIASGQKIKLQGMVVKRDSNSFVLRDMNGSEFNVQLGGTTKVEEKKSNPFRGCKKYSTDQVIRGLYVEVEGRGDGFGRARCRQDKIFQ